MNKERLIASGTLVGLVVLIALGFAYLSTIRNAFYVVSLNSHPAVESLNLVLSGEVAEVFDDSFTLTSEGRSVRIYVDERTAFAGSPDLEAMLAGDSYEDGDIVEGDTVRVNGIMLEGDIWADSIIGG